MTGKDIIFFGGVDWFARRKLPVHHVVKRLAQTNRIFYIDNFGGCRDFAIKDIPRALRKLKTGIRQRLENSHHVEGDYSDIVIYQPLLFPTPRLPMIIGRLNRALLRRGLKRLVNQYQIQDPVIWTRGPTDVIWHGIIELPYKLLVYQSVDRFPYSPMISEFARPRLSRYEKMFCQSADLIFASARGLFEEKRRINPNTYFFPNGVDLELFRSQRQPVEYFKRIQGPVMGFAGSLGPWVDYRLLWECASLKPEWSFVFIGPLNPDVNLEGLDKLANVHFVGAIEHSELPDWFKHFDVGLIPYLLTEFTRYTFPSKMAEYFAAGLPVISTPLPEIEPYANVVRVIHNSREMITAIQQELDHSDQERYVKNRFDVANALSWETIVSGMERLIDEAFNEAN